jgi:hypothetical protein
VNYRTEAGLYHPVKRSLKPSPAHIVYKRFKTAAAAIRFEAEIRDPPHAQPMVAQRSYRASRSQSAESLWLMARDGRKQTGLIEVSALSVEQQLSESK